MQNRVIKKAILLYAMTLCLGYIGAQTHVVIDNPATWSASSLKGYSGDIIFDVPLYVCGYSSEGLIVSPRRNYVPTNQEFPRTSGYNDFSKVNVSGNMILTDYSGYEAPIRTGMRIHNLRASYSGGTTIRFTSGEWRGNSRTDLMNMDIHAAVGKTEANKDSMLIICGMNVENYDARTSSTDNKRMKARKALAKINADIYGLAELRPGEEAIKEITDYLKNNLHKEYTFIGDGSTYSSTGQKVGFIFDKNKVSLVGVVQETNVGVTGRKKMIAFRDNRTDEIFIYSINHFKAKVSTGATGINMDQGDGQGAYNPDRVNEARAIMSTYSYERSQVSDPDILIMGDLNAYAKEDPLTFLHKSGMIDLHRQFHADSSYSYTTRGGSQFGYLDHALCSKSLLPQVAGMLAYHINSDERDSYSGDNTIFRCSDHDPIVVGLKLNSSAATPTLSVSNIVNSDNVSVDGNLITIHNAKLTNLPAFYKIYDTNGTKIQEGEILTNSHSISMPRTPGVYFLWVMHNNSDKGAVSRHKIIVY